MAIYLVRTGKDRLVASTNTTTTTTTTAHSKASPSPQATTKASPTPLILRTTTAHSTRRRAAKPVAKHTASTPRPAASSKTRPPLRTLSSTPNAHQRTQHGSLATLQLHQDAAGLPKPSAPSPPAARRLAAVASTAVPQPQSPQPWHQSHRAPASTPTTATTLQKSSTVNSSKHDAAAPAAAITTATATPATTAAAPLRRTTPRPMVTTTTSPRKTPPLHRSKTFATTSNPAHPSVVSPVLLPLAANGSRATALLPRGRGRAAAAVAAAPGRARALAPQRHSTEPTTGHWLNGHHSLSSTNVSQLVRSTPRLSTDRVNRPANVQATPARPSSSRHHGVALPTNASPAAAPAAAASSSRNPEPHPLLASAQAAAADSLAAHFDAIINSIDADMFSGHEQDLVPPMTSPAPDKDFKDGHTRGWTVSAREVPRPVDKAAEAAVKSSRASNFFAKANMYANSRLPQTLPPLKLYLPAYPLICLAAQYSQRVYERPTGKERETHVGADWRTGTKAMVIKSIPVDDRNVVVFAIRGSQTFMDWAVNLHANPASPDGFLDDASNLCHAGFLSVARNMVKPVAARLRTMLEEDPSRSSCSLLFTGHSAGGAVAALLFSHMFSEQISSELTELADSFKRVHCLTFGAPPVSLFPLRKPVSRRFNKSLFMSFINEGDPVPRCDRAYLRSLLDLYRSPAPTFSGSSSNSSSSSSLNSLMPSSSAPVSAAIPASTSKFSFLRFGRPKALRRSYTAPASAPATNVVWPVPKATLLPAGRLVILRGDASRRGSAGSGGSGSSSGSSGSGSSRSSDIDEDVRAVTATDQQLRGVMFGDPVMHMMKRYARRVEALATNAVMGRGTL